MHTLHTRTCAWISALGTCDQKHNPAPPCPRTTSGVAGTWRESEGGRGHPEEEAGWEPSLKPPAAPPPGPHRVSLRLPHPIHSELIVSPTRRREPPPCRAPYPSTESPAVLHKRMLLHIVHRFIVQGTEGEEEPGRERRRGGRRGKDGGRGERRRLSASRRCRWRKGVTSG